MSVPNPDDPGKLTPKKVYYLACGFCRWTSRDVGIPDQVVGEDEFVQKHYANHNIRPFSNKSSQVTLIFENSTFSPYFAASGGWPEQENPHAKKVIYFLIKSYNKKSFT